MSMDSSGTSIRQVKCIHCWILNFLAMNNLLVGTFFDADSIMFGTQFSVLGQSFLIHLIV